MYPYSLDGKHGFRLRLPTVFPKQDWGERGKEEPGGRGGGSYRLKDTTHRPSLTVTEAVMTQRCSALSMQWSCSIRPQPIGFDREIKTPLFFFFAGYLCKKY